MSFGTGHNQGVTAWERQQNVGTVSGFELMPGGLQRSALTMILSYTIVVNFSITAWEYWLVNKTHRDIQLQSNAR